MYALKTRKGNDANVQKKEKKEESLSKQLSENSITTKDTRMLITHTLLTLTYSIWIALHIGKKPLLR